MPSDIKTCERTEGAAVAVQAKHGDSCSANQVDPDPMCLTSFGGDSTGPPALLCSRDDALRRCGVKVVSLICEDTHANSLRWLTPRRRSLYIDEDHL